MTRLDHWSVRRGVHIRGALRTPSGHLDQIACTRGVPGGGSWGAPDSGPLAIPEATALPVEGPRAVAFGAGSWGPH